MESKGTVLFDHSVLKSEGTVLFDYSLLILFHSEIVFNKARINKNRPY